MAVPYSFATATGSIPLLQLDTNFTYCGPLENTTGWLSTGTSLRFSADFSNVTDDSRFMFRTSTTNGNSIVGVITNGTGTSSSLQLYNKSTASSASYLLLSSNVSTVGITSGANGVGSQLPMTFTTNSVEQMRIDTSGNFTIGTSGSSSVAKVAISNNTVVPSSTPTAATNLYLIGANSSSARLFMDSFNGSNVITGRLSSGTAASPTSTAINQNLISLQADGYTSSYVSNIARVYLGSESAFAAGSAPTFIAFETTPSGSVTSSERFRIDSNGNVAVTGAGSLGYSTGSGGTVTQTTSSTNPVTIHKTNGAITGFTAAGSPTETTFAVLNNKVASTDVVVVCTRSSSNTYLAWVSNVTSAQFTITFKTTGGTLSGTPVFVFAIIKSNNN